MYQDAVDYLRTEEGNIDTIETEILKMPDKIARMEFSTSEFIGADDLLGELRKRIPQNQDVVNTRKIAESVGITDCDIDVDLEVSYAPITEKIKLVTAKRGVYEARLKIDAHQYLMFGVVRVTLGNLRHGLTERRIFEHAGDDELLKYLEGYRFKTINAYSALTNNIIDNAKEKLKLPSSPEGYGPAVK